MEKTTKRLQRLNEIALSSYIKNISGEVVKISDPRLQGAMINRISVGMQYEEQVELNLIFEKKCLEERQKLIQEIADKYYGNSESNKPKETQQNPK